MMQQHGQQTGLWSNPSHPQRHGQQLHGGMPGQPPLPGAPGMGMGLAQTPGAHQSMPHGGFITGNPYTPGQGFGYGYYGKGGGAGGTGFVGHGAYGGGVGPAGQDRSARTKGKGRGRRGKGTKANENEQGTARGRRGERGRNGGKGDRSSTGGGREDGKGSRRGGRRGEGYGDRADTRNGNERDSSPSRVRSAGNVHGCITPPCIYRTPCACRMHACTGACFCTALLFAPPPFPHPLHSYRLQCWRNSGRCTRVSFARTTRRRHSGP
jgi:hypothetical protein